MSYTLGFMHKSQFTVYVLDTYTLVFLPNFPTLMLKYYIAESISTYMYVASCFHFLYPLDHVNYAADGSDAANAFEENKRELENLQTELITTRAERDRYQSQVTQMEQSMQQSATQL